MKNFILAAIIGLASSQSMANTVLCAVNAENSAKSGSYDQNLVLKQVQESELLIVESDYFIAVRVDRQAETISISSGNTTTSKLYSSAVGSLKGQVVHLDGNRNLITVCTVQN